MAEKNKVLEIIEVRATLPEGMEPDHKVVFWERHEQHPDKKQPTDKIGEAFVVRDGKSYRVALTPKVKRALGEGSIERVNWNSRQQGEEESPKKPEKPKQPVV